MKAPPDLLNGVPILFNRDETHALTNHFRHLRKVCDERADGWQVEMIANVQQVNRLIYRCIHRGRNAPDPQQMPLPLG